MTEYDAFQKPRTGLVRRALPLVAGLLVAALLGWFVWKGLTGTTGVRVEPEQTTQVIDTLPPPPPPPPPPPVEEPPPEPIDQPAPTPEPQAPAPAPDAPAPMQIDGPAQAGADSYGLQSGSGGGMGAPGATGSCIGPNCGSGGISDAFYRRALSSALQEHVQANERLNRQVFSAELLITVSPQGKVTTVAMVRSSGRQDRDETLLAAIRSVEGLDPPPPNVRFPQRVTVRGRRSV